MSQEAANQLWQALQANAGTSPVRAILPENDLEAAYATQKAFNQMRLDAGQRLVGRKSGFTNPTAQAAMGVNTAVSGLLFDVMDVPHRGEIPANKVIAPKIEGEIAFIMGADLTGESLTMAEIMRAVDYITPAIEIVDARTANWDVTGIDTVSDNVSASHFTIGHNIKLLDQFDVSEAKADIHVNGQSVATGTGANVLGSPLNSLCWLANQMLAQGTPIQEGDVILSGSLGPMIPVNKGDLVEVFIQGAGMVSVAFAAE
ncbi:MAG: 2-keto-4-pentenoate hydratase [Candidatus Puniceispirillaceae bacterium]